MDSIFCHGGDVRKPFIFWPGIIDNLKNIKIDTVVFAYHLFSLPLSLAISLA